MSSGSSASIGRARSECRPTWLGGQEFTRSNADPGGPRDQLESEERHDSWTRNRMGASMPKMSFSSSLNQKTPARSYFQHPLYGSHQGPVDISFGASQGVREDTAELASLALSDITSNRSEHSPSLHPTSSTLFRKSDTRLLDPPEIEDVDDGGSNKSTRPEIITETSEPSSPRSSHASRGSRCHSALTDMLKTSPTFPDDCAVSDDDEALDTAGLRPVTVHEGIISQPHESTRLLGKRTAYGSVKDIENQKAGYEIPASKGNAIIQALRQRFAYAWRDAVSSKTWRKKSSWKHLALQPAILVPPVVLGLLLNILDALSYGLILFPLADPLFQDLGSDGIAMFYVSCIVSQLVFSLGGSGFRGAVGSEMIEVVPFFHQMAFTIVNKIGRDGPESREKVRATVVAAFSISTILTGLVFFGLGRLKLGSLIGFFPRHILVGCVGGVGLFLVRTGFEVSARLPGSLNLDLATLHMLIRGGTLPLWIIPLVLALLLFVFKKWKHNTLIDSIYFISIIAVFWIFVGAIPALKVSEMRERGWIFEKIAAGKPWYHFYTLYSIRYTDWNALGHCVPAMLALTFFAILHVPINVPALAMAIGADDLDLDRELTAHGISNFLSGICGSIQNYLVFANTSLFMRSGGDDRLAGTMLAAATLVIMVTGQGILGFVPVLVVGALIFYLGFDLLSEALVGPWGKTSRLEYLTVVIIVITMVAWDFVYGIFVGIILACVSYVLQTSQVSAVRGKLYGGDANSTVRRHPIQNRFLESAGRQIYVMKLAGYLFFGTIVDVEKQIRAALDSSFHQQRPIRYLVLDLYSVDGVDFSASESFARIHRILGRRDVQFVMCGVSDLDSKVGRSLRSSGLFDKDDGIRYFQSLNVALEFCENQLLRSLRHQQQSETGSESTPLYLEIPKAEQGNSMPSQGIIHNSPRMNHLQQVAINTLSDQDTARPTEPQDHRQPLRLILQTFSTVSEQKDDFWLPISNFFVRRVYSAGTVLYRTGDAADGFFLLESGLLKAKYELPQGSYSELIVAGTTCGELPFFSSTSRTATTYANTDCITWMLDEENWQKLQCEQPKVAQELLKISLKLTKERMDAVTKYMLLTSG